MQTCKLHTEQIWMAYAHNVFLALCIYSILTWNRAEESILKPSDPGCLTRVKAPASSTARKALKATLPNDLAWVSGWALS